jgi:hypothetical protein
MRSILGHEYTDEEFARGFQKLEKEYATEIDFDDFMVGHPYIHTCIHTYIHTYMYWLEREDAGEIDIDDFMVGYMHTYIIP